MTIFAARNNRKNADNGGAEKRAKKRNKLSHSGLKSTHRRAATPQTARAEEPRGTGKRKENVISTFLHSMKSGFTEINKSIICRRKRSPRRNDTATEARKESGGGQRNTPPQSAEKLPRSTNFPTARRGERARTRPGRRKSEAGKQRRYRQGRAPRAKREQKELPSLYTRQTGRLGHAPQASNQGARTARQGKAWRGKRSKKKR